MFLLQQVMSRYHLEHRYKEQKTNQLAGAHIYIGGLEWSNMICLCKWQLLFLHEFV